MHQQFKSVTCFWIHKVIYSLKLLDPALKGSKYVVPVYSESWAVVCGRESLHLPNANKVQRCYRHG